MQKSDFFDHIQAELSEIEAQGMYKRERLISGAQSSEISVKTNGSEM